MALLRIISPLLLCLILLQPAGPLLLFTLQRAELRGEMRQRILRNAPDEQLVLLAIPGDLERHPGHRFRRMGDDEFRLDGRMYDVVRSETSGDTTWCWCINDDEETALFDGLDRMIRDDLNNNPARTQQTAQLSRFFALPYIIATPLQHTYPIRCEALAPVYAFSLQTRRDAPPSPPPEA